MPGYWVAGKYLPVVMMTLTLTETWVGGGALGALRARSARPVDHLAHIVAGGSVVTGVVPRHHLGDHR